MSEHDPESTGRKPQQRTCILVLGMHRSGTSALTRVINLLGAGLPQNVMGAGPGNETGHWEPIRLVSLHDRMLAEAGSSWDDWRPLDLESTLGPERLTHYRAEIRQMLVEEYADQQLFVIKDPRVSRFVGLYRQVLEELDIRTTAVLMVRNPLSVAGSLGARNEIDGAQAWLYWLRYVLDGEAASRALPRSILSYEDLMADWRQAISPLATEIGVDWPVPFDDVATQIEGFLSADQRHHSFTPDDLERMPGVADWIKRAYHALGILRADADAAAGELDAVSSEFETASGLFAEALAAERATSEKILAESRTMMAALREEKDAALSALEAEKAAASTGQGGEAKRQVADPANSRELQIHGKSDDEISERQLQVDKMEALLQERDKSVDQVNLLRMEISEMQKKLDAAKKKQKSLTDSQKKKIRKLEKQIEEKNGELNEYKSQAASALLSSRALQADYSLVGPNGKKLEALLADTLLIIPSINGGQLLERMLPSVDLPSRQIVVLDQGSTDSTYEVCAKADVEVVQLDVPHTYTQACNIGLRLAKERGCSFLVVANNDIEFKTRVMHDLRRAMEMDSNLAIVAPSQIIIDAATNREHLAYRVFWDLQNMRFEHDFAVPDVNTERLESDFCELTLAMVRVSVTDEVGFLDDEYGFYFEDADFGFRLREAGYSCAYLVQSQIAHYHSSTFNKESAERKSHFMAKNKRLFRSKHLGVGVNHADHGSSEGNSWNIINTYLHPYLLKFGLVDHNKPSLIFSHPGTKPFDYLYTVWETASLPAEWARFKDSYQVTMATSQWVADVFRQAGYDKVSFAPLGVEPDIFHPWGKAERFSAKRTYLWFANNQHRKGLDVILKAWREFHKDEPGTHLVLMGRGIREKIGIVADAQRRVGNFEVSIFDKAGISIYENCAPISAEELATIYRSVDFVLNTSRSEGFGFTVAEAMACGTPAIFGNYASTAEFVSPNALTFGGKPMPADYTDKGFADVGDWFEPVHDQVVTCLRKSNAMDAKTYSELSLEGMLLIRGRYTWRHTVLAIRNAIQSVQSAENDTAVQGEDTENLARSTEKAPQPIPRQSASNGQVAASAEKNASRMRERANSFAIRTMRRSSFLLNRCAEEYERRGGRAAVRLAVSLFGSYVRSRSSWVWMGFRSRIAARPDKTKNQPSVLPAETRKNELAKGTLFVGYVEAGLGLGETLRAMITAAEHQGLPFSIYPFNVGVESRRLAEFMPERYATDRPHEINVITVAADQVPQVFNSLPTQILADSYNILYTFWELPNAPEEWRSNLGRIDELWAPNSFVADAFRPIFDGPIHIVPPCVEVRTKDDLPSRESFGLEKDRFYYLFSFDYYSSPFRKNPLGVLAAFRSAFPNGDENVGMVIKSVGSKGHHPDIKETIRQSMAEDPRIISIEESLSREDMLGLIDACDCYVSLHRAEGFGYGMVEAMRFGKPVVGTAYSGSADFLEERVAYPVDYKLRDVMTHEYVYTEGQQWAEPDQGNAASRLRDVFQDQITRKKKAAMARQFASNRYGRQAVGETIRDRLSAIRAELSGR